LIDDAAIARRITDRPAVSNDMARHQMEARKIPPAIIETLLNARQPESTQALVAARHLDATLVSSLSPATRRRRLLSGLASRGFDEAASLDAVDQIVPAPDELEAPD
jgi:hypothetical protein